MDDSERAVAERRARVFKAMAHPARVAILSALERGPMNVGELTAAVGGDISTVSKHLAVLSESGLALGESRGKRVYYSLYCRCVPEFLRCVDEVLAHNGCELPVSR